MSQTEQDERTSQTQQDESMSQTEQDERMSQTQQDYLQGNNQSFVVVASCQPFSFTLKPDQTSKQFTGSRDSTATHQLMETV